jgi:hypothetical protein
VSGEAVKIGAEGIDTDAIVREAKATAEQKQQDGTYRAAGLNGNQPVNPLEFRTDEAFLAFYLENLRDTAFVDISDFEIEEHRPHLSRLLILFKRLLWKLLKFYTYRLWSQQNQINGQLLSAIEGVHEQYQDKIEELEERIKTLEGQG